VTKKRVEIISEKLVFKKLFFRVMEARLRHETTSGDMSEQLVRLNLDRGDAAAAILYDPAANTIVMVEQFRYPTLQHDLGWLLELPAGIVKHGEDPPDTIQRELIEETGYKIDTPQHVLTFYTSPGGASERIFLYYATITPADRVAEGGGLPAEREDIRILTLSLDDALEKVRSGEIVDAKTIIGLQWLERHLTQS
jgi:ADP-ribose pyrophosphatase